MIFVSNNYEKLGVFYLGREYDPESRTRKDELVLYDSKDPTTHAVCVGMTGSGKTGLCICLLEEAAIDGIPSIVIDPKGDLSNLMLTFPNLSAEQKQLAGLESQLQLEIRELEARIDPQTESFQTVELRPKKANISVRLVALTWIPI